jgi:hypothetical protein
MDINSVAYMKATKAINSAARSPRGSSKRPRTESVSPSDVTVSSESSSIYSLIYLNLYTETLVSATVKGTKSDKVIEEAETAIKEAGPIAGSELGIMKFHGGLNAELAFNILSLEYLLKQRQLLIQEIEKVSKTIDAA